MLTIMNLFQELRLIGISLIGFVLIVPVHGQGVVLRVRQAETKKVVNTLWATDYGSYNQQTLRSQTINVTVRNQLFTQINCTVKTTFYGESLEEFAAFERKLELKTDQPQISFDVNQPVAEVRDNNYAALGTRDVSGVRTVHWLVVVRDTETEDPLAVESSDGKLKQPIQKQIDAIRLHPQRKKMW